jgi:hypothetical protein
MRQSRWIAVASVFLAATLSAPARGTDPVQPGNTKASAARPGSVNYVEGQVSIEGRSLRGDWEHRVGPGSIARNSGRQGGASSNARRLLQAR